MASPLQVLVGEPGHLVIREASLVTREAQGHVLDGLVDVGPLLPNRFEFSGQLATRSAAHVAADDLGLAVGVDAVPFVERVASGASEAAASGDLGNHDSSPSCVSV